MMRERGKRERIDFRMNNGSEDCMVFIAGEMMRKHGNWYENLGRQAHISQQ